MSTEIKHTNRGGKRAGAGRPTKAQAEAKAAKQSSSSSADIQSTPISVTVDKKKHKLNPVKEIARIYVLLKEQGVTSERRKELLQEVAILEKLLPFTTSKKPVQSLQDNNEKATTIKIETINFDDDNEEGIV